MNDELWVESSLFDAAFGKPRNRKALRYWNSSMILDEKRGKALDQLKATDFWVTTAAKDGQEGNLDRGENFIGLLRQKGIHNASAETIFHPDAAHNWHWADRFLTTFLRQILG